MEHWTYFRDSESADIIGADGYHVARVEPVNSCAPESDQDANGRLLAAAPVMRDALRLAIDALTPPRDNEESKALAACMAALNQAES